MGGGASKGGGKPKKGGDKEGAKYILKAQESQAEAKTLFEKIDANKDGKLTKAELTSSIKNFGKDIKANWSDLVIDEVISFFDRDGDGMLDLEEFTAVLSELKARGKFDAASLQERKKAAEAAAKKTAEIKTVYDEYLKGGVWDKGSTGKLIRKFNDEEAYWDDFGAKVTSSHAQLTGDESRKATATLDQFVVWYPQLLAETQAIKAGWQSQAAEQKAVAANKAASQFAADKPEWQVMMKELPDALEAAWAIGKTPLVIDVTTPAGENKSAGFSPLENFYSYSGDIIIELKKAVVETGVKKEKTVDEVQDEFAKKLLNAAKQGRSLMLLCSNSAPPLKSKFACPRFPLEMLDAVQLKKALDDPQPALKDTFMKGVEEFMKSSGMDKDPSHNLIVMNPQFRVVAVTKFDPEDYKGFLGDEWPLDMMMPIKCYSES